MQSWPEKYKYDEATGRLMLAEKIISRLEGVKQTGPDRWVARCPAHDDRTPSLAIREVDDRVLLHCFAGCDVNSIVAAVVLELADLFPPSDTQHRRRKSLSRPFPAADVLRALQSEIIFIGICANDIAEGQQLTTDEVARLFRAAGIFKAALTAGGIV